MSRSAANALTTTADVDPPAMPDGNGYRLTDADARRIREVLDREHVVVWRTLRRFGVDEALVDDATQNVFMTFVRRIHDVDPGRERAFLMGVSLRVATNLRRQATRRREVSGQSLEEEPDVVGNPEQLLESKRRRRLLDQGLDELPEEQRTVFVLYEIEGLSLSEVAENLQIPLGTVSSRLRRARLRFQTWVVAERRRRREGNQ